jgi:uncharacterized protein (TIGR03435 family)
MRLISLFALLLAGQEPASLRFEVVSVKPAGPKRDGPSVYKTGPERIIFERQSLLRLINIAYRMNFDQISGPAWLGKEFYEVNAKISVGSGKEQVQLMWQNLLADRFGLKVHFTTREVPAYELTVAKNGPKLRKSVEGQPHRESGFPEPPPGGRRGISMAPPRTIRQTFRGYSTTELCQLLAWIVAPEEQGWSGYFSVGRVVNKTGLDGSYDFTLEFAGRLQSGAFPPPLPDGETDTASFLFEALQQQLGLKLDEKKLNVPALVVDSANKVPAEN